MDRLRKKKWAERSPAPGEGIKGKGRPVQVERGRTRSKEGKLPIYVVEYRLDESLLTMDGWMDAQYVSFTKLWTGLFT